MDLPTCPSCGASVLDEDASECPFCGAAMSASSKPAGKSQPAPAAAGQKPQLTKRTKRETVSDDDPFELERQKKQADKVIPLSRKPTKGKMFRVVCPMCDTPGFSSPKVVGREVKCRNPECLAPVFRVPNPDTQERKKAEPTEPKEKKKSILPLILVLVVVTAGLGVAYWQLTKVPDGSELAKPFDNPVITNANDKKFSQNDKKDNFNPLDKTTQPKEQTNSSTTPVDLDTVQKSALDTMVDLSRVRENRSKPFSRRLTAEAYAVSGDVAGSQGQMERIDELRPPLPFYKIFPLIEMGWIQLKDKSNSDLKETLDQTVALSKEIPPLGGRDTLDLVSRLAAFWVAAGKEGQAIELTQKFQDQYAKDINLAQLSAMLQIAHETKQYQFDSLIDLHQPWDAPQWVATTLILIAHGYPQEALNWAASASESIERTEAVTHWALAQLEQAVEQKTKPDLAIVQPAEKKLSPTGNASMYARCARTLSALQQKEAAQQFLTKAVSFLSDTPVPAPVTLGGIKQVNELNLPDAAPLELLAKAYFEVACAEGALGQKAEALKYLSQSVQTIRATAPGLASVQNKMNAASNFGFQDQIKEALNLESPSRLREGVRNYNRQLRNLKSAAEQRQSLLVKLLSQAARSGLAEQAWSIVSAGQADSDIELKDSLLDTTLPAVILESAGQNNQDLKTKISSVINQSSSSLSKEDKLILQTNSLAMNGKPEQAAHEINQSGLKKAWKAQLSLQRLSVLLNQSKFEEAIQFMTAIKDPVLREDMLNAIATIAVKEGKVSLVTKLLKSNNFSPTEKISGYLGLVSGIQASKKSGNPSTPPSKEESKNL